MLRLLGRLLLASLAGVAPALWALDGGFRSAAAQETIVHKSTLIVSPETTFPIGQAVRLGMDKSMIVEVPVRLGNVVVSNPDILDAVVQTTNRVILIGRKVGQANALLFDEQGERLMTLEVIVEFDYGPLRTMLERMFPGAGVTVESANENLVLRGSLSRPVDATRAAEIASSFLPTGKKLINMIEVKAEEQVMLQVTVAEMHREEVKRLGVNWNGAHVGDAAIGGATNNGFPVSSGIGRDSFLFGVVGDDIGSCIIPGAVSAMVPPTTLSGLSSIDCLTRTVQAFERSGVMKTLAEPKLTAISGETASFLAGGEFPIPVAQDKGTISVQWKPFGVGLSFTPVVLDAGRISMKIATEVSEISTEGAITLDTISIPSLSVRRASTTVEMPSGGSLVMAGLLSDNLNQNIDGIPGLKDIPILGKLFRSKDYRKRETELVVIVTPYVVRPTAREALARPDDGFMPDANLEGTLMGRLNRVYGDPASPPAGRFQGDIGFIIE
ncbi:MAG: type II and III secretion system protein family protein [Hyphomicrobiaceae bacterium]